MSETNTKEEVTRKDSDAIDAAAGSPAPAAEGATRTDLAEARKDAELNRERFLRAMADLENYRKRVIREKEEIRQFGASSLMESLIPVMDNLALALAAARQQPEGGRVVEGVAMIFGQLRGALEKHGLKEITAEGQPFDPALHECISHQANQIVPSETVISVVRAGYSLNGRLVRPASVVVSSGPTKDNPVN